MRALSFIGCFGLVSMFVGCQNNGTTTAAATANGGATTKITAGTAQSGGDTSDLQGSGGASESTDNDTDSSGGTDGSTDSANVGGTKSSSSSKSVGGSTSAGGTQNTSTSKGTQAGGSGATSSSSGTLAGGSQGTNPSSGTAAGTSNSSMPPVVCDDTSTAKGTVFTPQGGSDNAEIPVAGKEKSYWALSNWWSVPNGQTVDYNGFSWTIHDTKNTVPSARKPNDPVGFPTMYIGKYSGHQTKGSNLPKLVSELTTIPTIFSTNSLENNRDTSNFNAAYDVWFTKDKAGVPDRTYSPGVGGAYLMVWLFDPANRQPRGGVTGASGGVANVAAHEVGGVPGTWDVWIDKTDPLCISYVATTPVTSLEFDLNDFIKDAVSNSYGIKADMYLSLVFAGFEVWGGGDGLQVKNFCVDVK